MHDPARRPGERAEPVAQCADGQSTEHRWGTREVECHGWRAAVDQRLQHRQTADAVGECVLDHEDQRDPAVGQPGHHGGRPRGQSSGSRRTICSATTASNADSSPGGGHTRCWRCRSRVNPASSTHTGRPHPHGTRSTRWCIRGIVVIRAGGRDQRGGVQFGARFQQHDRAELVRHGRPLHGQVHQIGLAQTVQRDGPVANSRNGFQCGPTIMPEAVRPATVALRTMASDSRSTAVHRAFRRAVASGAARRRGMPTPSAPAARSGRPARCATSPAGSSDVPPGWPRGRPSRRPARRGPRAA